MSITSFTVEDIMRIAAQAQIDRQNENIRVLKILDSGLGGKAEIDHIANELMLPSDWRLQ